MFAVTFSLLFQYTSMFFFFLFSEGEGDFRGGQLFVQNEVQRKPYVQSYRIVAGKMPGTGGEEKMLQFLQKSCNNNNMITKDKWN